MSYRQEREIAELHLRHQQELSKLQNKKTVKSGWGGAPLAKSASSGTGAMEGGNSASLFPNATIGASGHDRPHTLTLAPSGLSATNSVQASPSSGFPQGYGFDGNQQQQMLSSEDPKCGGPLSAASTKKSTCFISEDMMHYLQDLNKASSKLPPSKPTLNELKALAEMQQQYCAPQAPALVPPLAPHQQLPTSTPSNVPLTDQTSHSLNTHNGDLGKNEGVNGKKEEKLGGRLRH